MKGGIGRYSSVSRCSPNTGSTVLQLFLDLCYAGRQELGHSLFRTNTCQAGNKLAKGANSVGLCIRHGIVENKVQDEVKQRVLEM